MRAAMSSSNAEEVVGSRAVKRRRKRSSVGMKRVKRVKLDGAFGGVAGWEGAESGEERKIVTRSQDAAGEEMLALPDEEHEDIQVEDEATIVVLDEDGTVLDVGADAAEGDNVWEDELDGGIAVEEEEEAFDDTMMHLGGVMRVDAKPEVDTIGKDLGADTTPVREKCVPEDRTDSPIASEVPTSAERDVRTEKDAAKVEEPPDAVSTGCVSVPVAPQPTPDAVLPDGFVSPIQRRPRPARNTARQSLGSRRRTLPMQFAPTLVSDTRGSSETTESPTMPTEALHEAMDQETKVGTTAEGVDHVGVGVVDDGLQDDAKEEEQGEQDDWEDVEDDTPVPEATETAESTFAVTLTNPDDVVDVDTADVPMNDTSPETEPADPQLRQVLATQAPSSSGTRLPSSPIPTIEGQHPRLPLRRSPRRKSSSPLKQSTILPSTESLHSHMVAFTPIKAWPARSPAPSVHPGLGDPFSEGSDTDNGPSPARVVTRAASPLPEGTPRTSPQKPPPKPRVSDDTALLQAFLNRAAESKGKDTRRVSATKKRESITNKQDSDVVRQALASSAKAADSVPVLGDLDPNSPSPRKPSFSLSSQRQQQDGEPMVVDRAASTTSKDDTNPAPPTRRSGRATRKAQPPTATTPAAAPNRISIRNNNENAVTLKLRTEAQELAALTRNNTRKNKGGAILPPARLTKMALFSSQTNLADGGVECIDADDTEDAAALASEKVEQVAAPASRSVRWAETLAEFHQGPEVSMSESSVLSDELNAQPEQASAKAVDCGPVDSVAPPPPSETPSKPKPKIRRLKPSRTAGTATPGDPSAALPVPTAVVDKKEKAVTPATGEQEAPQDKAHGTSTGAKTKRRSRIATPAKGLLGGGSSSLLPPDLDPTPAPAVEKKKLPAPGKRKAPVSKLPAPATASVPATTATTAMTTSLGQGQGKENALLSSPAKKKSAAVPTIAAATAGALPTTKAFAPKLDFGKASRLDAPAPTSTTSSTASGEVDPCSMGIPGLASPAKKGGGRRGAFFGSGGAGLGGSQQDAEVCGGGKREGEVASGFSSPAKKRTRRAAGI